MTKAIVLAAIVSFGTCCVATTAMQYPTEPPIADMEARVFQLSMSCPDGVTESSGSAVDLGGGYFATAKHITEGHAECMFQLENERYSAVAWLKAESESADVALLLAPLHWTPPIGTALHRRGMRIVAVGYPMQLGDREQALTVTDGMVAGAQHGYEVRITTPIYFGSSGGAVFDWGGNLVGISTALFVGFGSPPIPYEGTGQMTPISYVYELLE